jgi:hypothetical protein
MGLARAVVNAHHAADECVDNCRAGTASWWDSGGMVDRSRLEELRRKHRPRRHPALAMWAEFPIRAEPRPFVFIGPTVVVRGGFYSSQAKAAVLDGAITSNMRMPPGLLEALNPTGHRHQPGVSLEVTGVLRTQAEFLTDRGPRSLPAWSVTFRGSFGRVIVLHPPVAARGWWPDGLPPAARRDDCQAQLLDDGQTLTVTFEGWGDDYPRLELYESQSAVVFHPVVVAAPMPFLDEHTVMVEPPITRQQLTASLAEPLGARVLLDIDGYPLPVLPAESGTDPVAASNSGHQV